jgi:hypothetical protein
MTESSEYTGSAACLEECQVCLGEHDEDIHAATVNVHAWFRSLVTRYFESEELDQQYVA